MKLRDMKKTGVNPTQLKKEKVVEEAMAQLELNKNTTTPNSQPHVKFARPFKFTVPSEVCGVVGHYNDRCPYIKVGLPDNVTEAPKGYEIVTFRGGKRAVRIMFCGCCKMLRDHKIKDCPNKSETAIMNSILKAARPPAGLLTTGCCRCWRGLWTFPGFRIVRPCQMGVRRIPVGLLCLRALGFPRRWTRIHIRAILFLPMRFVIRMMRRLRWRTKWRKTTL
nr:uncharacterized protein LOC114825945 [Malus domestica]